MADRADAEDTDVIAWGADDAATEVKAETDSDAEDGGPAAAD